MHCIVASDSDPSDIEKFMKDHNLVLQSVLSRYNNDYERVFVDMEAKREAVCEELDGVIELKADEGKKVDTPI